MASVQADRGAIKFVLSGSDIMDPGVTSEGGKLPEECIEKGKPVLVFAEGKASPMAVGVLMKSTDDIRKQNEGKGIQNYHYIDDGLWNMWVQKK
jgi:PUA domain protein